MLLNNTELSERYKLSNTAQSILATINYVLFQTIYIGAAVIQQSARFKAVNIQNIPANSEYKTTHCGFVGLSFVLSDKFS